MSSNDEIEQKIARLCSYVCNGKTYNYEQRLYLATKHGLYDAAIIYAWNIFMLFVYEKVWQLREVEKEAGTPNKTDKVFLDALNSNKPIDYFDGHLCSLGKIQTECKQGEDFIVGKLKDIYKNVDQQYFKKAQGVLLKRNEKAHLNSFNANAEKEDEKNEFRQVLSELIQVCSAIQVEHNGFVTRIFELLEKKSEWHISDEDMRQINAVFSASGNTVHKFKYVHVANLIVKQEFSPETVKDIKDRAIQYFLESKAFRISEENAQLLINPLTSIMNQDDIRKILTESFNNGSYGHNQILQASSIEDIFIELHSLSQNNFPELEQDWSVFITKIKAQGYQNNFKNLILEIESPSTIEDIVQ